MLSEAQCFLHDGKEHLDKFLGWDAITKVIQGGRDVGSESTSSHTLHPACWCVEVDGKPMTADPSQEGKADAAHLMTVHPDTLHPVVSNACYAKLGEGIDEPSLDDVNDVRNRIRLRAHPT